MAPKAKAKVKAKAKAVVKPKLKAKAAPAPKAKAADKGKAAVGTDAVTVLPGNPLAHRFYGDTQAFLCVPTKISPSVLADGYKVEVRDAVPCSTVPGLSVKAMTANWTEVSDCMALEVHGVPASMLDVANGRINTKHLESKYLRDGVFVSRGVSDYLTAPCPLCGKKMPDKADQRGQVGQMRYVKQAFMVTPCDDPKCVQLQVERQKRLNSGKTLWLYHITSKASADLIKSAGGKMVRGGYGNAGGGIYFGLNAKDCLMKAQSKGVILKCRVQIGTPLDQDSCSGHSFAKLIKAGHDCVWGKIGYPTKSYIIYSWDQVQVAAEVTAADVVVA